MESAVMSVPSRGRIEIRYRHEEIKGVLEDQLS